MATDLTIHISFLIVSWFFGMFWLYEINVLIMTFLKKGIKDTEPLE